MAGQFDTLLGIQVNPSARDATEPLTTPLEYRSQNGELNVTLEARETQVRLGKELINGATYNGVYGGPVLRLKQGDVLHLQLVNHRKAMGTTPCTWSIPATPGNMSSQSQRTTRPGSTGSTPMATALRSASLWAG